MAGSKVDRDPSINLFLDAIKGYKSLSLTSFADDVTEPDIAAGSRVEVNGDLYIFNTQEDITGFSSLSDGRVYIKVVPSGETITAEYTATAPTWSDSKQGYYDGNDRYIYKLWRSTSSFTPKVYGVILIPYPSELKLISDYITNAPEDINEKVMTTFPNGVYANWYTGTAKTPSEIVNAIGGNFNKGYYRAVIGSLYNVTAADNILKVDRVVKLSSGNLNFRGMLYDGSLSGSLGTTTLSASDTTSSYNISLSIF